MTKKIQKRHEKIEVKLYTADNRVYLKWAYIQGKNTQGVSKIHGADLCSVLGTTNAAVLGVGAEGVALSPNGAQGYYLWKILEILYARPCILAYICAIIDP